MEQKEQETKNTEVVSVKKEPAKIDTQLVASNTDKNVLTLSTFTQMPIEIQAKFANFMAEQLEFEFVQRQAKVIQSVSPNISIANAFVLATFARQNSISWIEVLNRFCVISGKICEGANSIRSRLKKAGCNYSFEWGKKGENETCRMIEKLADGRELHGETWSLERARNAGIASKDVWRKYPREMLMARATTSFVKMFYPELIAEVSIKEEVLDGGYFDAPQVEQNEKKENQNLELLVK